MTRSRDCLETLTPWLAGLLLAMPVLVAFYPPMTDLPYHESAIGILRHFGNTTMFPRGLYHRNLGQPNQLFHLVGWALSWAVSTRWAVKLLVAATVIALPTSAAHFARHVGASPLASLVIAPMALGWLFSWGLIANLVGLAAFLFVLPALDRFADKPTWRAALPTFAGLVLLYLAHEAMMFIYAGIALAFAVLRPWSWSKTAWRSTPFILGVGIALGQAKWQQRFMTPVVRALPRVWQPLWHKLDRIPFIVLPATERPAQFSMLALCILTMGLFLRLRARERAEPREAAPSSRPLVERVREKVLVYRWEVIAAFLLVSYFAFPLTLNGATLVYHRWFPPAFAIFAIVAAPRDLSGRAARVPRIALAALPLATLFAALPSFVDSNREYRALEHILPAVEPGSALASLNMGPGDRTRMYSLGPAAGRILATRGGRLAYAFTDSPISPAVIPRRYQWTEALFRVGFNCWAFRPAHDLQRFRYVLVFVRDPALAQIVARALEPEAEYVTESGNWALFESRLPLVPLLSRDVPLEKPPPETLHERVSHLIAQLPKEEAPEAVAPPAEPEEEPY